MLTAQTNLAGRYQIVQAIGSGGFGQTYLAKDLHLPNHPLCVVKQFRPHPDQGATIEKLLELFDKEAKALYNLGNHDCIPRLLAHFNEGSEFYLAQEYIEGHTLTDELTSMTKMHESHVINLLKDILEVLTFVHQNNVIHRDIKPSNLIRRKSDGKIVLIDFGAVKEVSRGKAQTGMTSVSIAIGSYGYMPDEQAANKPRYASDIYAVGKIAIQALTGMRPDQLSDDPATGELVWQHHAQVSPQLGAVIDRMVRSHFRDRYADASEALTALQSLTSGHFDTTASNYFAPTVISQPDQSPTQTGLSSNNAVTVGIPISPNVANTVAAQNFVNPIKTEVVSSAAKTVISDSNPTYVVGTKPAAPNSFHWNLWLSLAGIASIGLAGFGAYAWMRDRDFQNAIAEAKSFQSKANYDACLDKLTLIPKDAAQANEAKSLSISCQSSQAKDKLASAKGLAKDGKYQEAITIANTISAETPSHAEAQTEVSKWSDSLLIKATDLYSKEGKLEQAIEMAQKIPAQTPAGKKATDLIPKWQSAWTNSEANYKEATAASKKEDWKKVVSASKQVADTPYWTQKVLPLRKQAEDKIALINAPIPAAPVSIPEAPIAASNQAPVYTPPEPTYSAPTYSAPVYVPPEPVYTAPAPPPEPVYVPPAPSSNACSSRNC
ncbi:serine/threonine-protein kinase [Pseudanabaena sp. ABRG5-3]|uniref:serine/threonine-protein kinase n=1 Tax=Pseudanabaena sp. ABRG5-3 TaxID=685565 RepID=UPI000DC6D57A|nr:serine/threonine-protein kinase [Pseudanabaena sp. ABRG5-3]BBC24266.1 serine/threonine protein kinase [Pseudanabaena sp. ABRG5-3]